MKKTPSRRQFLLCGGTSLSFVNLRLLLENEVIGAEVDPSNGSHPHPPMERAWYSDSGSKLLGNFVEFKPTPYDLGANKSLGKVVLTRSSDQKDLSVPLEKLSEFDRVYIGSQLYAEKDIEQFEVLHGLMIGLKSESATTIQALKELEKGTTTSPYASLWFAVALAVGANEIDEATRANERALIRCQNQRELDPNRHRFTLASVWNNQGVLHIKNRKFDLAIADFERAIGLVDDQLPVVMHNVASLRDMVEAGMLLKGQTSLSRRLKKLTETIGASGFQSKLSKGWYFSFAIEPPKSSTNEFTVLELPELDPTMELVSVCSGIVVAPGFIVTSREGVIPHNREVEHVTVGVISASVPPKWTLLHADEVKLIGSRSDEKINTSTTPAPPTAPSTSPSKSGFSFRQTTFQILAPADTASIESDVAVVKCSKLSVTPAPFTDVLPVASEKALVKGFGRNSDSLKNGQFDLKATVIKPEDNGTFLVKTFNDQPLEGNATVDQNYHVIGVHGESRPTASTESSKEGTSYSVPTVQKILQRTNSVPNLSLNKNSDKDHSKKLIKDAVVPLFGWARRKDIDLKPSLQSKLLDLAKQLESMVVRDVWCVRCNGTAQLKCTNCKGSGKVVDGYKEIVTGRNPVNGLPITQQVLNYAVCRQCEGTTRVRCNQCNNGKL